MKTFELTQEQINQLAEKKHAKELLKEFIPEAFKTKLEAGKWYKKIWKDGDIDLFLIDEINGDYIIFNKTYFRNNENITCDHSRYSIDEILNDKRLKLVLATEEEVSEALINEAKKRGYKETEPTKEEINRVLTFLKNQNEQ